MKKLILLSLLFSTAASAQCLSTVSGTLASDITDTTSTQVIAAASGYRNDLKKVIVTNSSATGTVVKIMDGSTVKVRQYAAPGGGFFLDLGDRFIKGSANTAWNIQAETTATALQATFIACKNY